MTRLPHVGETAEVMIDVTDGFIEQFIAMYGDDNPVHRDDEFAKRLSLPGKIAHGGSYAGFLSALIGTKLPGPGSIWVAQTYRFISPAVIGDRITLRATVVQVAQASGSVTLAIEAFNQKGKRLLEGESVVRVPHARATAPSESRHPRPRDGRPVALVVGAGGALGSAIAMALGRDGFAVALAGRDQTRLQGVAAELNAAKIAAMPFVIDLADDTAVAGAVHQMKRQLGPASLVVHCASAHLPDASPCETPWDSYRHHFEVQVGGLHRLLRSCTQDMQEVGDGQFIFVASTAIHGVPPKGLAAYTAAKAAACALMKSVAAELGPKGIRANIVSPHFMETALTFKVQERARRLVAAQTPLRRLASLQEVAEAVSFLASKRSGFINGHELVVDGGATMS